MKKSKITAVALMVLAVAACNEESKPTESATVQPTESAVVQPQAVEQVKTTVQTQAVEQIAETPAKVENTIAPLSHRDLVKNDYTALSELRAAREGELTSFYQRLSNIQETTKEEAREEITNLRSLIQQMEADFNNLPLQTDEVKQFRNEVLQVVKLTNDVLTGTVELISDEEADPDTVQHKLNAIGKQAEELNKRSAELEETENALKTKFNL